MKKYILLFLATLSVYTPTLFANHNKNFYSEEQIDNLYSYLENSIAESKDKILDLLNDENFDRITIEKIIILQSRIDTLEEIKNVYIFSWGNQS